MSSSTGSILLILLSRALLRPLRKAIACWCFEILSVSSRIIFWLYWSKRGRSSAFMLAGTSCKNSFSRSELFGKPSLSIYQYHVQVSLLACAVSHPFSPMFLLTANYSQPRVDGFHLRVTRPGAARYLGIGVMAVSRPCNGIIRAIFGMWERSHDYVHCSFKSCGMIPFMSFRNTS